MLFPSLSWHPCDKSALSDYHAARRADEAEEVEPADVREMTVERVVFNRLSAHWFSAGPQPAEVMQRVFAAAADRRPDLLRGFTRKEIQLAREETPLGRKWRMQALFPGEEKLRARYREIVGTLATAFAARRRPLERVTLAEALSATPHDPEPPEATETLSRVLGRVFADGNDPRAVVQHTFALTGWLFRDLQFNMSLAEIGRLFAEGRATQSWRTKKKVEGLLRAAGFRGCQAGWQKPAAAVERYRQAAQGNKNRKRKSRRSRRSLSKSNPQNPTP